MVSEVKKQALLALFASIEELKAMLDRVDGKSGLVEDGGEGSGNYGHKGRPGKVGGSSANGGAGGSVRAVKKLEDTDTWKTFVSGDEPPRQYVDRYEGRMTANMQAVSHQLFDELGYTGLPQEIPDDEYEQIVEQTGLRLLRGKSKVEYHKDLLTGAFYMGEGVSGYGTYSVENRAMGHQTAEAYGSAIVEFSLSPGAKVGEYKDLEAELDAKLDKWSNTMFGKAPVDQKVDAENNYKFFTDDRSRYCALQGYDAVVVRNKEYDNQGNQVEAPSYYIILNRNKIIYPKGAKIRFGANNYVPVRDSAMLQDGGEGSGNFGHAGRAGKVGGSAPGEGASSTKSTPRAKTSVNLGMDESKFYSLSHAVREKMRKERVMSDIGCDEEKAEKILKAANSYGWAFSYNIRHREDGIYNEYADTLSEYLEKAPVLDKIIFKGKSLSPDRYKKIVDAGEFEFPMIESWSESSSIAGAFTDFRDNKKEIPVIFKLVNNQSAVGTALITSPREKEVLSPEGVKYRIVKVSPVAGIMRIDVEEM